MYPLLLNGIEQRINSRGKRRINKTPRHFWKTVSGADRCGFYSAWALPSLRHRRFGFRRGLFAGSALGARCFLGLGHFLCFGGGLDLGLCSRAEYFLSLGRFLHTSALRLSAQPFAGEAHFGLSCFSVLGASFASAAASTLGLSAALLLGTSSDLGTSLHLGGRFGFRLSLFAGRALGRVFLKSWALLTSHPRLLLCKAGYGHWVFGLLLGEVKLRRGLVTSSYSAGTCRRRNTSCHRRSCPRTMRRYQTSRLF